MQGKKTIGKSLIVFSLILFVASVSGTIPDKNHYWTLNGTNADDTGIIGGLDGTTFGTNKNVDGLVGDAHGFDASSSEYIDVGSQSSVQQTDNFATSFLFKADTCMSSPSTRRGIMGNRDNDDSNNNGQMMAVETDGKFRYLVSDSGGSTKIYSDSSSNCWDYWTLGVIQINSGTMEMYINTTKQADTKSKTAPGGTDSWAIGNAFSPDDDVSNYWDGKIDEVAYHNDALTSSEVTELYDSYFNPNTAPNFSSVNFDPSNWVSNKYVNVSANVTDDGNVSYVVADVWENGTQIKTDVNLSKSSGLWQKDKLFKVDKSDVYYNVTLIATDDNGVNTTYNESQYIPPNSPPLFDSKSISPDQPNFNDVVSYGLNVSDSDGRIVQIDVKLYENGNVQKTRTNSSFNSSNVTKNYDNFHTISYSGSKLELDTKFTITDNDGATTTEWVNRTLRNKAPNVSINKPIGKQFNYTVPVDFKVNSSNDDEIDEDLDCRLFNGGNNFDNVTDPFNPVRTFTLDFEQDLGSSTFKVSCTDGLHTVNKSSGFSVNALDVQSVSGISPVFETSFQDFDVQFKAGEMVENITADLVWNGSNRNSLFLDNSGITSYSENVSWRLPIVKNNASSYNWKIKLNSTVNDLNSNTTSNVVDNSSNKSQTVYQAYIKPKIDVKEDKVIEKEKFNSTLSFTNKLNSEYADVNGYITFNGSSKQVRTSLLEYPLVGANSKSTTKTVSGRINVGFRGRSQDRFSVSNDSLTGYKKILTDCSNSVNGVTGVQGLNITLSNEENKSQSLRGDIDYNFDVTKNGVHSRNYAFDKNNVSSTTLCIYPSFAEYKVTGPIDYSSDKDQNKNDLLYPQRNYKLNNNTVDNNSEKLNLYLLEDSLAQEVVFKVIDKANDPVKNVNIKTLRYFTGSNSFLTISKEKTDSNGEASTQLKDDTVYKYILTKNGNVLEETGKEKLICSSVPCTKTFQIGAKISPYFAKKEGFSYKVVKLTNSNGTTNGLQATVNHDSGVIGSANLSVEKKETVGYSQTCSISTSSTGQSMVCQFNETVEGNLFKYSLTASKDGQVYALDSGVLQDRKGLFGKSNPWAAATIFLVLTGLGLRTPKTTIALGTAGAVFAWFIGLITVSTASIASLVIIAGVVMLTGET